MLRNDGKAVASQDLCRAQRCAYEGNYRGPLKGGRHKGEDNHNGKTPA